MVELTSDERRQLLAVVMRERFGPIVIRDPDDDQPYDPSARPDSSLEAYAAELLDWRAG